MDCRRFSEKLVDAALEPGDVRDAGLAAHLEACADCQREFAAQRRLAQAIDRGLAAAVSAEPSPAFAAGVRARLAEESAPRASWFSGWVPVAAGALAVLVLIVTWFARREGPEPVPGAQRDMASLTVQPPMGTTTKGNVAAMDPAQPPRKLRPLPTNRMAAPRTARHREPEVIVPTGQREAVLRFYAAVISGRTDASWALEEMKPLEVTRLKIPPLEPVAVESDPPGSGNSNGLQL